MILDPQLLKELMTPEDVELVLDVLGKDYKRIKGKLVGKCPNPAHIDRKPSWDINVQKNSGKFCVHSCFSCGYSGDIVGLVKDTLNLDSRLKALKKLNEILNKTLDEEYLYERNLTHRKKFVEIRKSKKLKFSMPTEWEMIQEHDSYCKYLLSRGITWEIIEKAHIGKCETGYYAKRVVVPIYFNHKPVFFFARNNDKIKTVSKEKRGWYPKHSKSSEYIYPYDWIDFSLDYIIIVEGTFDCLRLWSLGYKNVVCIFGNRIHKTQVDFLKKFKRIILVPDADGELDLKNGESTKGMVMIQTAYEHLIHDAVIEIVNLPRGNDPGDVHPKKLFEAFRNPQKIFKSQKTATEIDYGIKKRK